ncbi:hypothetical protein VCHC17A1_3262, partial [Vibrio cholerae HC-17A1]
METKLVFSHHLHRLQPLLQIDFKEQKLILRH